MKMSVCRAIILFVFVWIATTGFRSDVQAAPKLEPVTIAQYGHLFLYMPIYVAVDHGYFKEQGLDVKLVSTGGDEKTFTAVASGNAQFGVADPVFAAIAREHGQGGKVVAKIVSGVPEWIVTYNNKIQPIQNVSGFTGYRIATYNAPSTSYSVMKNILQNNGHPVDAKVVQSAFGTLQALLKANQADMALELEPTVSIAMHQGAHIVYAAAEKYGDFAFTGLTVSDNFCKDHPGTIQKVVDAINKAMNFIHENFEGSLAVAKQEFPEVPEPVLRDALKRLIQSGTTPKSPVLSKHAWDRAIALRKEIGDVKGSGDFDQNVDMKFAIKAAR